MIAKDSALSKWVVIVRSVCTCCARFSRLSPMACFCFLSGTRLILLPPQGRVRILKRLRVPLDGEAHAGERSRQQQRYPFFFDELGHFVLPRHLHSGSEPLAGAARGGGGVQCAAHISSFLTRTDLRGASEFTRTFTLFTRRVSCTAFSMLQDSRREQQDRVARTQHRVQEQCPPQSRARHVHLITDYTCSFFCYQSTFFSPIRMT